MLTPWQDSERKVAAVEHAFRALPATWDADTEDRVFGLLFDVFRTKLHHATELPAVKPTVAEFLGQPGALTFVMPDYDPDYPVFRTEDILDAHESVPELEALMRWAMVLHNQYPWDRSRTELRGAAEIGDDDFVVAFHPRNRDVMAFIERVKRSTALDHGAAGQREAAARVEAVEPVAPYPPVRVREAFAVQPKLEALAIVRGEHVCDNADVIRNASFSWSPMSAAEISAKTGIEQRRYTSREPEQLALHAARAALAKSGRDPAEIGAVLVSTCTSNRQIPSMACWLSGEFGLQQTHASVDLVAACAGLPYGLAEAIRQLQEVRRPVLLVCVEKFSDKIGSVRTSRMIFGDGAAAMVIGPVPETAGATGDVEVVQTYASGPHSEVNSIIWPNSEFDGAITVYGPEVKSLVQRYLAQMLGELGSQPDPDDEGRALLDSIDLIIPHQANKTMILNLAGQAGLSADQLYFNVERMGNVSAASIPIAVYDAVRDGVITRPVRVFAPGFGAGAVGGYAVLRIDPAIVADEVMLDVLEGQSAAVPRGGSTSDDIRAAFGE